MDPLLAEGEAKVAAAMGQDRLRFRLVDLDAWQRGNAELKAKMPVPPSGDFLTAADLPAWMTVRRNGVDYVLWPDEKGIDLKEELVSAFDRYAEETYRLLGISFAVLLAVLVVIFRRDFFAYVLPITAAVVATAGVLGWIGEPVNFFQLLCFFLLVGLGIDYTIFHRRSSFSRVVLFSFLTSLVGFGMLAFTSFQVTRSMGLTLGSGLFFAYFFSLPGTVRSRAETATDGTVRRWSERPEVGAHDWNIALMFFILRLLGRGVAKTVAWCVVAVSFPFWEKRSDLFSREWRARFRKFVNFAWSLVDKSAACAGYGNPPRFVFSGDEGWKRGGCFLLSTHVGCIEVLPYAAHPSPSRPSPPLVHAFQQLSHNSVFTSAFLKHVDPRRVRLHAVEEIGVETAVEMQEAIRRGEIVLMAGDRDPASGGRKGVFRFAKLMEAPVYAIICVARGWNEYEVRASLLGADLEREYGEFLSAAIAGYPDQWYEF